MNASDPIAPDSPLGRALSADPVPELPVDFADRIVARTANRPAALPDNRPGGGGVQRWRSAKRLGLAVAVSGALATAAAATGLLGELPSAQQVWNAITGSEPEPAAIAKPSLPADALDTPADLAPGGDATVRIEGPIDTPEELEEVFRRIDRARDNRRTQRQDNVDRRIDEALARRRAQGLPVPDAEQEARLRERLERAREQRESRSEQRIDARREQLRERVEAGEELTPGDLRGDGGDPEMRRRIEELRDLPPEQRRARIRELREQRRLRLQQQLDQELERELPQDKAPEPEPRAPGEE